MIYIGTDGGAVGMNGRSRKMAAWAYVVRGVNQDYTYSGLIPGGTNNMGELEAIRCALQHTIDHSVTDDVTICSDSKYAISSIILWPPKTTWVNYNIIMAIRALYEDAIDTCKISIVHVKAHQATGSGVEWELNRIADALCTQQLKRQDVI